MCEVAVCEGDDGGHERTCSRVSRCECNGVESERRDTQVCVVGVETTTATSGQRPSSGRSGIRDRAGFTQQRARGPGRASHETAACAAAEVKPGPGTPAVDVANPADGQKLGWDMDSEWMGSPGGRVCETLPWPAQGVLFAERTAQVTDGQSTCARVGNPSECEVCFWGAQSDVMAARVVGIRQEGVNPCRMVPSKGTRYTCSCMTSRSRCKVRELRVAALVLRKIWKKKNNLTKASLAFG